MVAFGCSVKTVKTSILEALNEVSHTILKLEPFTRINYIIV